MNVDHEIYHAPEDEIPLVDKARLDGYLLGRAEQVVIDRNKKPKFAASIKTKKKKKK